MSTSDYRDLRVWQDAVDLVVRIYDFTRQLPSDEKFGLVSQLRRAAVSVPSNIAEGNARRGRADYLQFLRMARGSMAELETQLIICERLGHEGIDETLEHLFRVRRQLQALIRSL
jgi:four helix bundle protein